MSLICDDYGLKGDLFLAVVAEYFDRGVVEQLVECF